MLYACISSKDFSNHDNTMKTVKYHNPQSYGIVFSKTHPCLKLARCTRRPSPFLRAKRVRMLSIVLIMNLNKNIFLNVE